eukprot:TRINITY_DN1465_c0_g1_i6.p1 TRINITY_DN1465_c0_g1~~TRINITY_DN1465_c0_g1_i6.p1  ORF type:complete len:281 (+),score=39.86 TRINITY_DN1465_c0_g1_i6:131-973(+)
MKFEVHKTLIVLLSLIIPLLISLVLVQLIPNNNNNNKDTTFEDMMRRKAKEEKESLLVGKNILFLIAHPDDEAMFFAPTILSLHSTATLSLLCLSTGNYESIGNLREKELVESCKVLGIPSENVRIINEDSLQDGPNYWNSEDVARFVETMIADYNIEEIITFDEYGISSHPNHISVYNGVSSLLAKPKYAALHVYKLITTNIVRKYTGPLEVLYQKIASKVPKRTSNQQQQSSVARCYISPDVFRGWKAMAKHKTQLLWFRYLFVVFSRYSYINTLEQV